MSLIGYARVSTADQTTAGQLDALHAAGCDRIIEETASGADRDRPLLARALALCGRGDVFVVAKLDRVARSVIHLLQVVEGLAKRGVSFRSLGDPVDTTTAQGRFTLQILGAVAELERELIRARTVAGLRAAKARGRVGGNPALRTAEGCAAMAAHRRALRPAEAPAPAADHRLSVVAAITAGRRLTLRQTGAALAAAGVAPAGGGNWAPATVARLVRRAEKAGSVDTQKQRAAEVPSQQPAPAIAAE